MLALVRDEVVLNVRDLRLRKDSRYEFNVVNVIFQNFKSHTALSNLITFLDINSYFPLYERCNNRFDKSKTSAIP